ncbi:hypothetical protein SAMN05444000_11010 [Shimia gijangensis]|uniref:Uncharacterized protein n=1 Tax=Shimia gijangensis TaxID=1470563 RepID=A0A1M6K635_9RHOB|nr:hypothetical protein SAMN05444000_11010 [Shimia gijangensis]
MPGVGFVLNDERNVKWCENAGQAQARVLSDKFERVSTRPRSLSFIRRKDRALRENSDAVYLEMFSLGKAAFLIEVIVNGGMDGDEFLQTLHPTNAVHRALFSSKR